MMRKLSKETVDKIREMYPDNDNHVIAKELGISHYTVIRYAQKNRWHKSEQFISQLRRAVIPPDSYKRLNTPQAIEKRVNTMQKLLRTEKARILFGLEQKTNCHIRLESKKKTLQRNYLTRRGYIIDEPKLIAYYTEKTNRSTILEKIPRGTKKGKYFSFHEYQELPK